MDGRRWEGVDEEDQVGAEFAMEERHMIVSEDKLTLRISGCSKCEQHQSPPAKYVPKLPQPASLLQFHFYDPQEVTRWKTTNAPAKPASQQVERAGDCESIHSND